MTICARVTYCAKPYSAEIVIKVDDNGFLWITGTDWLIWMQDTS